LKEMEEMAKLVSPLTKNILKRFSKTTTFFWGRVDNTIPQIYSKEAISISNKNIKERFFFLMICINKLRINLV
jgi:hypothetical protein